MHQLDRLHRQDPEDQRALGGRQARFLPQDPVHLRDQLHRQVLADQQGLAIPQDLLHQ